MFAQAKAHRIYYLKHRHHDLISLFFYCFKRYNRNRLSPDPEATGFASVKDLYESFCTDELLKAEGFNNSLLPEA
ncbi:hypothetical protein DBR32_12065 [Taibaiella sp. KBW10]|nr:hypothetical protein DBR32_12065 [Taibaiella sp. KBW10]